MYLRFGQPLKSSVLIEVPLKEQFISSRLLFLPTISFAADVESNKSYGQTFAFEPSSKTIELL